MLILNSEFSIAVETGNELNLKPFIQDLAHEFDAVLFAQPNTIISKSDSQHFLDKDLNLIIDANGNCGIDNLEIKIETIYFDKDQSMNNNEQINRKARTEEFLENNRVKVNKHLPVIESTTKAKFRTPREIAQRVTVLAVINSFAFDNISSEQATQYLKNYNLWDLVTPKEKDFLANPTKERKMHETWKCECIWTLLWVINKVDDLGSPAKLCSLDNIPAGNYPIIEGQDPNNFIDSVNTMRSEAEILDVVDMYYRLDWACVDARIKNRQMTVVNAGVVYERHYALNWLICYLDDNWDNVKCDT